MDDKSIVEMAVLAGEIMLRSGAETYRVEDTMKHILSTTGTAEAEALVMLTSIMVTVSRPGAYMTGEPICTGSLRSMRSRENTARANCLLKKPGRN